MSKWKVPVQSLIDHIKTAIDVDPWAKEMAEDLLKEQKAEYEKGFNDAMLGKQELMYEGTDGKWHKKDW